MLHLHYCHEYVTHTIQGHYKTTQIGQQPSIVIINVHAVLQ